MKKVNYYIIGNGGCAKDVLCIAKAALNSDEFEFKGFIEYQPQVSEILCLNERVAVIDESDFLQKISPTDNIQLFMGIGNSKLLARISTKFKSYQFPNLIHPSLFGYMPSIQLGMGNIIAASCTFTGDIQIGNFNMINLQTTIAHDVKIGDYNLINPGVNLSGGIHIGNENLIGTNATILQYLKVGNSSVLGAGATLLNDLPDNEIWAGNPAKKLKDNV